MLSFTICDSVQFSVQLLPSYYTLCYIHLFKLNAHNLGENNKEILCLFCSVYVAKCLTNSRLTSLVNSTPDK